MSQWYYGSSAGQSGPVEEQELRAMIASGGVGPETLVWRDGMKDWLPLHSVPELSGSTVLPTPYITQPPPGAYVPGYYPPVAPSNGLAIASMVCGIVGIITCYFAGLLGLPAVICGHMAISQINNSSVPMGGRGMAIAGLVLGYLGIVMSVGFISFFVFAISSAHP
ncbi:GYF domain-containing protein [Luteolibacter flavescens]|uniref:GYF domain-containing protein n=1 Tax=Luteolibacter flavescens TaxID=1859460 RepID=A0ABT3FJH6_9BACT|nr:GYF domain-containing protein [Luteolibacter flavescens]MCW1883721.1 GYF domain-containing protein [Luteolibacter flavescens]